MSNGRTFPRLAGVRAVRRNRQLHERAEAVWVRFDFTSVDCATQEAEFLSRDDALVMVEGEIVPFGCLHEPLKVPVMLFLCHSAHSDVVQVGIGSFKLLCMDDIIDDPLEVRYAVCDAERDPAELVQFAAGLEGCEVLLVILQRNLMINTLKVERTVELVLSDLVDCLLDQWQRVSIKLSEPIENLKISENRLSRFSEVTTYTWDRQGHRVGSITPQKAAFEFPWR